MSSAEEPVQTDAAPPEEVLITSEGKKPDEETEGKPSKSVSSPVKKVARPGKSRASLPSGSKKSGASTELKTFTPGDIVLGRLKGYPAWPARVCKLDELPPKVAASRSVKGPNTYCVQFFPVGDYGFLHSREITPLSTSDIDAYLAETHRKANGELKKAYAVAKDPSEWDEAQKEKATAAEEAEDEENEDVDELEDEEEVVTSGGKRKRTAGEKKDKKKKAKVAKKAAAADVESEEDGPKPKAKGKSTPKAKASESKAKPEPKAVVPENQAPTDDDPLSRDPECVKVKDWRHKLQRAFLGKSLPNSGEMSTYDDLFKTIENHEKITIEALQYSKIGKVMKKIASLEGIARNDELKITDRASKLMTRWSAVVSKLEGGDEDAAEAAGTNGVEAKEPAKTEDPAETEKPATTEAPAAAEEKTETKADEPAAEPAPADDDAEFVPPANGDDKMEVDA